jgi:hypothetical protein
LTWIFCALTIRAIRTFNFRWTITVLWLFGYPYPREEIWKSFLRREQ